MCRCTTGDRVGAYACRTVTDLGSSSNLLGFCIALLSVLSSTMQQIFCRTMQQRNGLAFLEFLSHTAAAQVPFILRGTQ